MGVGVVGSVGTLIIVAVTLSRGLAPLRRVADQAGRINALTLRSRFPTAGLPIELLPICNHLNQLLERLERSFERERCFSADVAHELRTPIAELRSLAEVGLKWPGDDQASNAAFKDTLAIARQMESIVAHLLAITRCEAGKQSANGESLDVSRLVEELWRPFAPRSPDRELQVGFNVAPGQVFNSDRFMLSSILTNLFENAVTYSPRQGSVQIELQQEGKDLRIRVPI